MKKLKIDWAWEQFNVEFNRVPITHHLLSTQIVTYKNVSSCGN